MPFKVVRWELMFLSEKKEKLKISLSVFLLIVTVFYFALGIGPKCRLNA